MTSERCNYLPRGPPVTRKTDSMPRRDALMFGTSRKMIISLLQLRSCLEHHYRVERFNAFLYFLSYLVRKSKSRTDVRNFVVSILESEGSCRVIHLEF